MRKLLSVLIMVMTSVAIVIAAGGGDITFRPTNMDPVHFSHDYHLTIRGIKCAACHFPTFSRDTSSFQIKKELLNKRDFCGYCHNGMKGFNLESEKNCNRCHHK